MRVHPDGLSLPEIMFLLAYDQVKQRTTDQGNLDLLMRAAALTELWLAGQITDEDKRAVPAGRPAPPEPGRDPSSDLVAVVLADLGGGRPRRWSQAVEHHSRQAVKLVRAGLAARGVITTEPYRILGLIPSVRVKVRDPLLRSRLLTPVRQTIMGSEPVDRAEPWVAAAAALAATVPLNGVADRRTRRAHKVRLAALERRSGPGVPALRRAIQGRTALSAATG